MNKVVAMKRCASARSALCPLRFIASNRAPSRCWNQHISVKLVGGPLRRAGRRHQPLPHPPPLPNPFSSVTHRAAARVRLIRSERSGRSLVSHLERKLQGRI